MRLAGLEQAWDVGRQHQAPAGFREEEPKAPFQKADDSPDTFLC
jgi:hypothetical protein